MADERLEQLKSKYQSVLNAIQQQQGRLQNVHIEGGKLLIRAEVSSNDAKNRIWDQIKLVDKSYNDLTADISVVAGAAGAAGAPMSQTAGAGGAGAQAGGAARSAGRTYTVQAGDTLSKIAREMYGDAKEYNKIFNANRDQLSDPDRIKPGQKLVIPE
ncbi:MAG TPA: LysM peptidoglycan-binding domain-containing protein [Bryobacteraceae bacterium]|nr:LysM peptidoglycan-binding domain-containing protein [Bryobacteraceae bacterium]